MSDFSNKMSYHIQDGQLYFQRYPVEAGTVDVESFEILSDWHARDKHNVYSTFEVLAGADPSTYEILEAPSGMLRTRFTRDARQVFFERTLIKDADAASFEVIDEFHGRDKARVFHCRDLFADVDVESFRGLGNSFAVDKHHAYYYMRIVAPADAQSFSVLNPNYWGSFAKDARQVYDHAAQLLPDADPASFEQCGESLYGKDKAHAYYGSYQLKNADPATFALINSNYAKDKKQVYVHQQVIDNADPDSFQVLHDNHSFSIATDATHAYIGVQRIALIGDVDQFRYLSGGYCVDDKGVYYDGELVDDADPKTFHIDDMGIARDATAIYEDHERLDVDPASYTHVDGAFSADATRVYFMSQVVPGLNPQTFTVLNDYYAVDDKSAVYFDERFYQCEVLPPVDIESFKVIPNTHYASDKNQVYHCEAVLPNSDPQSFEILEGAFAKDNKQAYYGDAVLTDADPKTFTCRDYRFAQDDTHMYLFDDLIVDADPHSFESLDEHYATDKNHVFYDGVKIVDADVKTFELIPRWYARDAQQIYAEGKALDIDAATARFLSDAYIADTQNVYFLGRKLEEADAGSFEIVSARDHLAKDANAVYYRDGVINDADAASFTFINQSLCRDKDHEFMMQQGCWVKRV